jgi:hypothetical protein
LIVQDRAIEPLSAFGHYFEGDSSMSVDVQNASPMNGPASVESKSDLDAKPARRQACAHNWSWGRQHEPYDWMDAHTPCDDLSAWR